MSLPPSPHIDQTAVAIAVCFLAILPAGAFATLFACAVKWGAF